jgi:glucose-6-phosphate 1-dehydrogenase
MVQNHMLQLLCLVAMEAPSSMDAECGARREAEGAASLKRINGNVRRSRPCAASTAGALRRRRGQGLSRGARRRANTETFVAIKAEIANWRWAGVPFYLRTGKRLATRVRKSSSVQADPAFDLRRQAPADIANQLVIRLQPDEGVKQFMMIKDPGPGGMRLRQMPLT